MFAWAEWIQQRIEAILDRRFLRQHGCADWKQFHHRYDPRVNYRASRIRNFYHGYPVFHCFENRQHQAYHWDVYQSGISQLQEWADANCAGRVRFDFHRVIKDPHGNDEWEVNEIGGGDYIFAAFENPNDYTLFALRWV